MIKQVRQLLTAAENLGLEILEVARGPRHFIVKLKNSQDAVCIRTVSTGSRAMPRDVMNNAAELRRFARGQYHGLKIVSGGKA